jgi:hypothetical protein
MPLDVMSLGGWPVERERRMFPLVKAPAMVRPGLLVVSVIFAAVLRAFPPTRGTACGRRLQSSVHLHSNMQERQ